MVFVLVLEIGLFVLPYISVFNLSNTFTTSILPAVLDDLTNKNREKQHLAVLAVNPELNKVAELKAHDMASKGYFAHTSPEGKTPWYWFNQVGYKFEYAGENLAIDFTDSQDVTVAWMNSPTHKANIIKRAYTEIGTGIATGTYEGNPTIFVAQVYAKPSGTISNSRSVKVLSDVAVSPKADNNINSTSSPRVLGSETVVVTASNTVPVLAEPIVEKKPLETGFTTNMLDKYLTSPRHILNLVLIVLGVLIALALIFKLFMRVDKRHPRLITNGLILLIVIFGIYALNNYFAKEKTMTTTSFTSFDSLEVVEVK